MPLIVEFELSTPILREVAVAASQLTVEQVYQLETGATKLVFWATDGCFEAIERALETDRSVDEYTLLEKMAAKRLYSARLTEWGADRLTHPAAAANDIAFLEITVTGDTQVRARVPSRDALFAYRESCRERDVPFRLQRIYHETEPEGGQYGLTDRQQEALLAALEAGYFDVPREATLSSIAERLEISDQALSARLRRGQANLLRNTVVGDDPI
ncbi:bacterio-opsin activator [Natronococcus pandeyae]|uniref:Bacterio-opsin activator n=1 Tax=Natronococcus pandeyae TaxID=2055836 RepID=A0A8J8TS64_9EURY|nr:helix-turn-helix domain-containing protein [Natronococcus pandeyae]TYL40283.1 bacterio-opsin activator [Natronococcus pandeyae]